MRSLFENLYPDEERASAYGIPYEAFYERGYRGIIYDIDNTLVPHGAPADERAVALFQRLHDLGFHTVFLSNNKKPRVEPFAKATDSLYLCKAGKPKKQGYRQAMRMLGTDPQTTLFVGDQIFTDIWGAKRCGIHCILTSPIHPKEEIQIVLKRRLEAVVLFCYHRRMKRRGKETSQEWR